MNKSNNSLSVKLLDKGLFNDNKTMSKSMSYYAKTMDIVERTHIAMGKKPKYSYSTASTVNGTFSTDVFASTY